MLRLIQKLRNNKWSKCLTIIITSITINYYSQRGHRRLRTSGAWEKKNDNSSESETIFQHGEKSQYTMSSIQYHTHQLQCSILNLREFEFFFKLQTVRTSTVRTEVLTVKNKNLIRLFYLFCYLTKSFIKHTNFSHLKSGLVFSNSLKEMSSENQY